MAHMNPSDLARLLVKVEEAIKYEIHASENATYRIVKGNPVKKQIADYTFEVLQVLWKRLAVYGINTHTMAEFNAFIIELKNELK